MKERKMLQLLRSVRIRCSEYRFSLLVAAATSREQQQQQQQQQQQSLPAPAVMKCKLSAAD